MGKKKKNKRNRRPESAAKSGGRSMLPALIFLLALVALFAPLMPSIAITMPVTMTQAIFFQTAVVLMLALWLPLAITSRDYRPRKSMVTLAVVAFGIMMLVSLAFSVDPSMSFWSQLWRMTGVWNMLHYVVWFLVLSSVIRNRKDWRVLLSVSCFFALIAGLYGMTQWIASPLSASVRSTLGNQSLLAAYVLPHIFIAAFLYVGSRYWLKWYYGLVMFIGTFTIVVSASRGAVLALVVSAAVMLAGLVYFSAWSRKRRLALAGLSLILPVMALGVFFVLRTGPVKEVLTANTQLPRFVNRVIYRDIGADRKLLWSYAWRGFVERPVFGWGNEMYGYLYDYYFDHTKDDKVIFNERWQDRAHNQYLDILVSYGVIGMITYLAMWIAAALALLAALKNTDDPQEKKRLAMLATFFVSYLVFVLTIFDTPAQMAVVFLVLALVAGLKTADDSVEESEKNRDSLRVVLVALSLPVCMIALWINVVPISRALSTQEALITLSQDRRDLRGLFEPGFRSPNAYVHGMRYAAIFETQKYMDLAQLHGPEMEDGLHYLSDQAELSAAAHPYSSRYLIGASTATRMYSVYDPAALDRSEGYAQQLIELTPNRFDGYAEMAEVAILRGEYNQAVELLKQAEDRVYTNRRDLKSRIYMLWATAHAGQRDFPAMLDRLKLAEENNPEAHFDSRLVLMLSRVVQPGDSIAGIEDHLDKVAKRYGAVPTVTVPIELVRQALNGGPIDDGAALPGEMNN